MPPHRLQISAVNPHLVCTLCDGYLVDATTIIECLHSFCRTCIVHHLGSSRFCPVCDVQVHKSRPLVSIRPDQTLQDLVYKIVPGLYENEMQRRRKFYAEHGQTATCLSAEDRGEGEHRFYSPSESFSITLIHRPRETKCMEASDSEKDVSTTRHLSCPAAFTVGHLKKFLACKFGLPPSCTIDIFYDEHVLKDEFSMMDVAYIYAWKRVSPMRFYYSISRRIPRAAELPAVSSDAVIADSPKCESVEQGAGQMDRLSDKPVEESQEVNSEDVSEPKVAVEEPPKASAMKDEIPDMNLVQGPTLDDPVTVVKSSPNERSVSIPISEPTYNRVKVVSAPERSALLSPTNGFRLKFIHDPKLSPKSRSKKSGRKGGRSSRHKNVPRKRLALLAPHPPPPPPTTCLTTQHLPQLAIGKLVPAVITTLVSTTAAQNAPRVASFPTVACSISADGTLVPAVPTSTESKSSTSQFINNLSIGPSPAHSSQNMCAAPAKELSNTEQTPSSLPVVCTTLPATSNTETQSQQADCHSSGQGKGPVFEINPISIASNSESETMSNIPTSVQITLPAETETSSANHVPAANCNEESFGNSQCPSASGHGEPTEFRIESSAKEPVESSDMEVLVKDSISAEFSDNDDLGCQPDLVVDEQKMVDSGSEDEDTALRKKITAIAEKEDEGDEADSGRASDMSCSARGEEDVGSPMTVIDMPTTANTDENHRHTKSNSIEHVIKHLYRQHEMHSKPSSTRVETSPASTPTPASSSSKDDTGALDLSTCTRKFGESTSSRPKSVANPVLDIKHRQQTYLPAPTSKQHTVCQPAPTPKPTIHHSLPSHLPSILHAQLTAGPKTSPLTAYSSPGMAYSHRAASSPTTVAGRATYTPGVPHQNPLSFMPGMFSFPASVMATYAGRNNMLARPQVPLPSTTTGAIHNNKLAYSCHNRPATSTTRKLTESLSDAYRSSPTAAPAHPRTPPSMLRMSPHHRSASPAPSPQQAAAVTSSHPAKPSSAMLKANRWKNGKNTGSNRIPYPFDQPPSFFAKHRSHAD